MHRCPVFGGVCSPHPAPPALRRGFSRRSAIPAYSFPVDRLAPDIRPACQAFLRFSFFPFIFYPPETNLVALVHRFWVRLTPSPSSKTIRGDPGITGNPPL